MRKLSLASSDLDRHLSAIVARAAGEIALAVRQNIAAEVSRLVGTDAGSGSTRGRLLGQKRKVITCPVCDKPGGGPKWGWFCKDHKDLPQGEKEKARAKVRARPVLANRVATAAKRGPGRPKGSKNKAKP